MIYGFALPSSVVSILARGFPKLKILAFKGSGTSGTTTTKGMRMGHGHGTVSIRSLAKFELNYDFGGGDNAITLEELYRQWQADQFLDGTFSYLKVFVELKNNLFEDNWANLEFVKYTPHRSLDLPRIPDGGTFPDQDIYRALKNYNDDLPPELKKRSKSTILNIAKISPRQEWLERKDFRDAIWITGMLPYGVSVRGFPFKCPDLTIKGD